MMDGFDRLDGWLRGALHALAPAARKTLFREIVRDLAARNRKRMSAQAGPDGDPWAKRKPNRNGRVRCYAKMMTGLRAARRLRATSAADGAELGWTGRNARIASVHQLGAADLVEPGGPAVKY
ncbi:MAG: phage virion morphogenesis protein, partial [Alphaproteobacteria bacterium]|nr:phage virion morphogenesis protein [Alphaproteobacteria bacterium]